MLNQDFIKQTLKLFEGSDVRLHFPEIMAMEIGSRGVKKLKICFCDKIGGNTPIQGNIAFLIMLYFTIVDTYIDTIVPHLEGASFSRRYCGLNGHTDKQIILSQVYRMLKILRNSAIHSRNSLSINNEIITVSYRFRNTSFKLNISQLGIELIGTVVIYLATKRLQPEAYTEALIRTFYEDIMKEMTGIEDEFGTSLEPISQEIKLKRGTRINIENPGVVSNNVSIKFSVPGLHAMGQGSSNYDFLLSMDGVKYLIPAEVLDENGEIHREQLVHWSL